MMCCTKERRTSFRSWRDLLAKSLIQKKECADTFIGVGIQQHNNYITLDHQAHIEKAVINFGLSDAKVQKIPIDTTPFPARIRRIVFLFARCAWQSAIGSGGPCSCHAIRKSNCVAD